MAIVSIPHSAKPDFVNVRFPRSVVHSLRPAARARDCSVERLIVELIEVAADEQRISAILDDD